MLTKLPTYGKTSTTKIVLSIDRVFVLEREELARATKGVTALGLKVTWAVTIREFDTRKSVIMLVYKNRHDEYYASLVLWGTPYGLFPDMRIPDEEFNRHYSSVDKIFCVPQDEKLRERFDTKIEFLLDQMLCAQFNFDPTKASEPKSPELWRLACGSKLPFLQAIGRIAEERLAIMCTPPKPTSLVTLSILNVW